MNKIERDIFLQKYEKEKQELKDFINQFNDVFIVEYKNRFPLHFISYWKLKQFSKQLSKLTLLPNKEEYLITAYDNEFFDAEMVIFIKTDNQMLVFALPFPININSLTNFIKAKNFKQYEFEVSMLKDIMNPDCFKEFDYHTLARKQGRFIQEDVKKDNPIILLAGNNITGTFLINGNHRTIQAMRNGKHTVKGYVVTSDICCHFGLTEDYAKLYSLLLELSEKIYGAKFNDSRKNSTSS